MSADSSSDSILLALSKSQIYHDYEKAFTQATGLPLSLHEPNMLTMFRFTQKQENPFCALMSKTNKYCSACHVLQSKLEEEARLQPKTLKCFAGLCETAVPVRVGEKLIAFLQTGQILLHRPEKTEFDRVVQKLVEWGAEVDLKKLEETYFNTRVLSPRQYESLIRLLELFARHLASCGNQLVLQSRQSEPESIRRAREHIDCNYREKLSLHKVAGIVNMSATYFSEKFKEATGLNFVDYVARTRIEKARNLLQNRTLRISEVAFEVGFQSLSQFNRAFKKITGQSPKSFRADESAVGK